MGKHFCKYCGGNPPENLLFEPESSGDVTLEFANGNVYQVPDMILHYLADHGWQPPAEFAEDVMKGQFVGGERWQTKSSHLKNKVGYLKGPFPTGRVPDRFVLRLQSLMRRAGKSGKRVQMRGG